VELARRLFDAAQEMRAEADEAAAAESDDQT
jgi:hypothetical protein